MRRYLPVDLTPKGVSHPRNIRQLLLQRLAEVGRG